VREAGSQHRRWAIAELEFSRSDVESLAQKLDTLKPQLSGQQQALLVAIFAAAADQVRPAGSSGSADITELNLADLRDQLLNSFAPSEGSEFVMSLPRIGPGGR
jgi:hypothetical protein